MSFYGADPIAKSVLRVGSMPAIALAAKAVMTGRLKRIQRMITVFYVLRPTAPLVAQVRLNEAGEFLLYLFCGEWLSHVTCSA